MNRRVRTSRPVLWSIALILLSGCAYALDRGAYAGCGCCGQGQGEGARASDDHANIHALLDRHEAIERRVEEIPGGVETVTTSADPGVAQILRDHVRQMQQRMESGQGLRWWDPVFAELFRRHEGVVMHVEEIPGGMRVRETSEDPATIQLIRQHAIRGVSEFVAEGHARARNPTPLPEGFEAGSEPAPRPCGRR